MTRTDEVLLVDYVSGDRSAFETLVNRHRSRLLSFVTGRLGGDSHTAEDVVQGVFIKIARHAHKFREGAAFRPWLYSMCDRLVKDYVKLKRRRARRIKAFGVNEENVSLEHMVVDTEAHEAHDVLTLHHDLDRVSKVLRHLPRKYRTPLHLTLKGFSSRQCEALLGMSHRWVQILVKKGEEILRQQMEENFVPEEEAEPLEEGTIRDIVDALPDGEYQSVERVVFEGDSTDADLLVFRNFLNRLLGNFSTTPVSSLQAAS